MSETVADGVTEIVDRAAQGGLGGLFITTTRGEHPAT